MVALVLLYAVSGIVALIYEVLWQRQFSLVFGSAAPATAAVLAAYFSGLALGSFALGRIAKRWPHPLRVYAGLEVLIALGAMAVSPMLNLFNDVQPWLVKSFSGSANSILFLKGGWAFFSILVPTFCMGGTLPVLGALVDQGQRKLGVSAGLLYVANTVGASLGALAVPFVLLRWVGAAGSVWLCAALNIFLALCAYRLQSYWISQPVVSEDQAKAQSSQATAGASILGLSFLSGLFTFVLQVLWNRAFSQVHENSVYSFALIVSLFILALAIGGQLARAALGRQIAPRKLLGWSWLLGGVVVAITPWLFLHQTHGLLYLQAGTGWTHYIWNLILLGASVLLFPITLLGIGFPALMEHAGRTLKVGASEVLGNLATVNMLGSIVGALIGGFLLPRWLGLWQSIFSVALLLVVVGAIQLHSHYQRNKSLLVYLVLAGISAISFWGITKTNLMRVRIEASQRDRLAHIAEGTHGIVAVVQRPDSRRLKLNNYYVLGGTLSAGDERMQAHVPLLMHPSPGQVAVLGLGTAITAGGASFHQVQNLSAVELVPEVIEIARTFFREANRNILEQPQTHIVLDDARNFLRTTQSKFDVIIGDLVVPWRQGEGSMLTLENFAAARAALAPGGLYCQWLPLFQLSQSELEILTRTFLQIFPRASVWRGDFSPDRPSLCLIGAAQSLESDEAALESRIRSMQKDPLNPQISDPIGFWMNFIGTIEPQDLGGTDERLNREDRPCIELIGPMEHGSNSSACIGRPLQKILSTIKQRSAARKGKPSSAQVLGSQAGDLLHEFTLSLSEGNERGAAAAQAQLKTMLPGALYSTIFP